MLRPLLQRWWQQGGSGGLFGMALCCVHGEEEKMEKKQIEKLSKVEKKSVVGGGAHPILAANKGLLYSSVLKSSVISKIAFSSILAK